MSNLLILGAGGHGKVVLDTAISMGKFDKIAFLDDCLASHSILEYPVIGKGDDYQHFISEYDEAIIAIGDNALRLAFIKKFKEAGYNIPNLIHKTAYVSPFATLGEGIVVMANAVINANATIGDGVIVNTGTVVEHDNRIEEGVHLSPNVSLGGTVQIGRGTWVGIGATVINNITIGQEAMIAAGAVVIRDVKPHQKVMGVPAKER